MVAKNNVRIGAVILAAGMSTRMGEPKPLLRLGESTLLGRVLENVRSARVDEVVLVLGFAADAIRQRVGVAGLKVVINEGYAQGMGASLRAGLSALDPAIDAALIVLADQPFVRPGTLDQLIDQYQASGAQIVIPTYRGFRGNPVLLDRSVFPEVMALRGDVGCRAIFGSHTEGIAKVPVDDVGILLDIDSKEDLAKLQALGNRTAEAPSLFELADLKGRGTPSEAAQQIVVVGNEPVGQALAKLAKVLQFTVTIVDPLLSASDFPEADRVLHTIDFAHLPGIVGGYVVVASRGKFDEEAIEQALQADSAYVALVANKKRGQEVLNSLRMKGVPLEKLARVHAPAGINIGGETPEEIALSVMAEIVSERHKSRP